MPNIANIIQTKIKTNITLNIPFTDSKSDTTRIFILTLCVINRKGLNVLKSLNIFTAPKSTPEKIVSTNEVITIKKSSYDQLSLR